MRNHTVQQTLRFEFAYLLYEKRMGRLVALASVSA